MNRCCLCGVELDRPSQWACGSCLRQFELPFVAAKWPAWAKSELAREQKRRRFKPTYGVDGGRMSFAPYARKGENQSYRRTNRVHKPRSSAKLRRVNAENILYSTGEGALPADEYDQALESMPVALRNRLGGRIESRAMLADAIRALPLISQRAVKGRMAGHTVRELAEAEGVSESTLQWLLDTARQRLHDILTEKLNGDTGQRFVD